MCCEFKEGHATNNADRDVLVRFTRGQMTKITVVVPAEEVKHCRIILPLKAQLHRHPCVCAGILGTSSSSIQWEHYCSSSKYPSLGKAHDGTWTVLEANSGSSSSLSKICFASEYTPGLCRNSLYITGGIRPCLMSFGALVAEVRCQAWTSSSEYQR